MSAKPTNNKPEETSNPDQKKVPRRTTNTRRGAQKPQEPTKPKELTFFERFIGGPNPRSFDNLFFASQQVLDGRDLFDGLLIVLTRLVYENFDLAHTIQFGSSMDPPGYALAAAYRAKGTSLIGKFFPATGTVHGRIQQMLWKILTVRLIAKSSFQPGQSQLNAEVDLKWKDCAAQLKYHNMQVVEMSYTQSITRGIQAGILGFYDMVTRNSGWKSGLGFASKWGQWAISYASVGNFMVSFTQTGSRKRQVLSTDMEFTKLEGQDVWEAIWSAGYMYNLFGSTVKGKVDSRLRASVFLEERVNDAISILMCADVDYLKDSYKIGFGMSMNT